MVFAAYWHGLRASELVHRLRVTRLTLGITESEAPAAHGVTLRTYRKWRRATRNVDEVQFGVRREIRRKP
jgi:hypothetical protein